MFVVCPLVHNYSVIALDIKLAFSLLHGPMVTKRLTVNVCLYSNKHQSHGCTVTSCFLIFD